MENTKRRADIIYRAFSIDLMTATTGPLAAYLPEVCNFLEAGQAPIWLMRPTVAEERLACMRLLHLLRIELSYIRGHELLESDSFWVS